MEFKGWMEKDIGKVKAEVIALARAKGYTVSDDRFQSNQYTVRFQKSGSVELSAEGASLFEAYSNALELLNQKN